MGRCRYEPASGTTGFTPPEMLSLPEARRNTLALGQFC